MKALWSPCIPEPEIPGAGGRRRSSPPWGRLWPRVTDGNLAEAGGAVQEDEGALVTLHPGAGDPRRRWPPEKFAAVGDALAKAGARVAMVGVEEDRALISSIVDAMEHEALDLCGRLSLGGLAGLLGRCAVAVSNDSAPLHPAGA